MIRLLVADDQDLVRMGLRVLAEDAPDIELVGEAADGGSALELARRHRPDVVLMDIRMPGMDGLSALRAITAELPDVRVIMLTTFALDEYVFEALAAGASGFLVKDGAAADLVQAVRVVAGGQALLAPQVTRRVVEAFVRRHRPSTPHPGLGDLTDREREVVGLVAEGLSNDEIAARLYLSPATVRTHVSRSMLKVRARDRAQLVVIAVRNGLTD